MKNIFIVILTLMVLVLGWVFFMLQPQPDSGDSIDNISSDPVVLKIDTESQVANGFTNYQDVTLGISFTYPEIWGGVIVEEFRETEPRHMNLKFSGILDQINKSPLTFASYKFADHSALGRGGYWGDGTDISLDEICAASYSNCETFTNESGITITSTSHVPFGCDIEGAVPARTYYFPLQKNNLQQYLVLHDGNIANANCVDRDSEIVEDFASMVDTIKYLD